MNMSDVFINTARISGPMCNDRSERVLHFIAEMVPEMRRFVGSTERLASLQAALLSRQTVIQDPTKR
jgi:hypothetical protein